MQMFFFQMNTADVLFKERRFIGDVYILYMFNRQQYCFVRNKLIILKPKRQRFYSLQFRGKEYKDPKYV